MADEVTDKPLSQTASDAGNNEADLFLSLFHPDPVRAQKECRKLSLRLKKMCECRRVVFTEDFFERTLEIVISERTTENVYDFSVRIAQRLLNELAQEDLDRLMARLDPDRDQAGLKYEAIRNRLIRFFRSRNCRNPEDLTDKCLDRLARRVATLEIRDMLTFALKIARFVVREYWRVPEDDPIESDTESNAGTFISGRDKNEGEAPEEAEAMMRALEACLDQLEKADRELILSYQNTTSETKDYLRKQLARRIGISMDALRVRTFRIRQRLEDCVNRSAEGTHKRS